MTTRPFKSVLFLLALLLPLTATAATPEEETKFVDAVKKAFTDRNPADLAKLTCWDGVSGEAREKQEGAYKLLVEEKDVTFRFQLIAPDPKNLKKDDRASLRPNLKIARQLDVHLVDSRDKRLLGIIGFAVGEKDGKLLLVREVPVN